MFQWVLLLDQAQRQEVASSTGKAARTYVYFQGAEDSVVKEYISQTVDGFLRTSKSDSSHKQAI